VLEVAERIVGADAVVIILDKLAQDLEGGSHYALA